jgi:hypothetical protein
MLALDVDGTLAARGDEVTPDTRAALARVRAAGVEVVIATGRRYRSTERVIESLGLPAAAVCLGGALTKETDARTLRSDGLSDDEFQQIARLMGEAGTPMVAQRDAHTHGGADFVIDASVEWNQPITQYFESNAAYCEARASLLDERRDDVLVAGTFGDHALLARLQTRLDEQHPDRFDSHLVPSHSNTTFYLEIIPARVSKWAGLAALAAHRGIPPESICAVGDQVNDLSMIRSSGLGVAMGNGHDEAKAAADFVCGRHDEDGLVEVVERILDARP